eukprot:TRINITY_DN4857_c0_g1_i2.p1 TRINITY_DN4857_c0_g1~~TRINITY_DN4857_c0_g1_i2.p1  ORF type:complete len:397 (-),score=74.85 TRINITY_DN4857_c0_g1_i2:49-1239(-)
MKLRRRVVLGSLGLELLCTLERQVFDFLGYMWLPILLNFLNILLVILGLFGVLEGRRGYLRLYLGWTPLWIAWNIFLICFYKDLGRLDSAHSDFLGLGTGSFSWWLVNGHGCRPEYSFDPGLPGRPARPSTVRGCKVSYQNVEVAHAGVQVLLGALGLILGGLSLPKGSSNSSSSSPSASLPKETKSMYSIEYSPKSAPNTPRRQKRRSNSAVRFSQRNRSKRSSRPGSLVNPVNRLMTSVEALDSSRPNSLYGAMIGPPDPSNSVMPATSAAAAAAQTSVSVDLPQKEERCPSAMTSYSNFHHQRRLGAPSSALLPASNLLTQDLLNHPEEPSGGHVEEEEEELPLPPPPAALANYCETSTLYAGAIPKRLPPYGEVAHGPACSCPHCHKRLTAI